MDEQRIHLLLRHLIEFVVDASGLVAVPFHYEGMDAERC
jgi:hypothetical protein